MKTIYDGRIIVSTEEIDGEFIANVDYGDIRITSLKTNREYAAIGEVVNEFKKQMTNKAKETK